MGSGFRNLGFLGLQGFGLRESGCEDVPYVGTVSGALCLSESLAVCLPVSPSLHLSVRCHPQHMRIGTLCAARAHSCMYGACSRLLGLMVRYEEPLLIGRAVISLIMSSCEHSSMRLLSCHVNQTMHLGHFLLHSIFSTLGYCTVQLHVVLHFVSAVFLFEVHRRLAIRSGRSRSLRVSIAPG